MRQKEILQGNGGAHIRCAPELVGVRGRVDEPMLHGAPGRPGGAPQGSPIHLDSVLVGPRQTVDVAFAANNPGVWMFHCHVLLHTDMGMTTSINYVGYSTPFEMGTRSGNMPE